MVGETEDKHTIAELFASVKTTLKDGRLWLIVLSALTICGLSLLLPYRSLSTLISIAVGLVASHLINRIERLPKTDVSAAGMSFYRNVLLPAAVGVMVISNSNLLARVWFMLWHWLHANNSIPSCRSIFTGAILGFLGVPVTAAITAAIVKQRAVFATVIGLTLHIPLTLTDTFSGGGALKALSIFAKSCNFDIADDFDNGAFAAGFSLGTISTILMEILLSIFVAKVVSVWVSREDAAALNSQR
jgi:hypothetical protein